MTGGKQGGIFTGFGFGAIQAGLFTLEALRDGSGHVEHGALTKEAVDNTDFSIGWRGADREEVDGCPCLRGNFCRSGKRPDGSYEPASWARMNGRYSELEAMGYMLLTD